ncbi:glycosyltransferase family 2 protein, partial [Limnobacter sp.]|uniref:glycosyltransferase family 2 protein n=1 Tax=Limnobacter sp. TaxID=2003368 RepID=UPI003514F920
RRSSDLPGLRQSITELLQSGELQNWAGFDMPRCNYFLGRYLRHGEGYPDYSRRLFHRQRAQWSDDVVHEKVIGRSPNTRFGKLSGDLLHHSADSLESYLQKQNRYTSLQAQMLAERGKWPGLSKLALSPLVRFIKFYAVRQGFRDGWPGFVHIAIGCFNSFIKYAKARELMLSKSQKVEAKNEK